MTNKRLLYSASDFPIFQNRMYATKHEAENCPCGQIEIVEDTITGLVYNNEFDPDLMNYDAEYQNEQGNSIHFQDHLNWVADLICSRIGINQLVEVGCGKGTFLQKIAKRGVNITGFDPTYEGNAPYIIKDYFRKDLVSQADGLILRHVLEHVSDPVHFLRSLAKANDWKGKIYIEVPCFDWICDHHAWFDLYYEHVNYFRLSDFHKIFGKVIASGHCFGGQYLYIIADLASVNKPQYDPQNTVCFPLNFMDSLKLETMIDHDVVWGAASKGLIYSLLRARKRRPVSHIVDINPAKQGKYLAVTGIQVEAPEDLLPKLQTNSRILIMNPNYTDEIKDASNNAFTYIEIGNE